MCGRFGETLADEHARGGAFTRADGAVISLPEGKLPNASMRLFGGAQFHRAMAEFRMAVGQVCNFAWLNISGEDSWQ